MTRLNANTFATKNKFRNFADQLMFQQLIRHSEANSECLHTLFELVI